MKALGFRAEPTTVHYALVEGTKEAPLLSDNGKFSAPVTYGDAESLAYYRDRIRNLIDQHKPDAVVVRFAETFYPRKLGPAMFTSLFARARIEGVVLEAAQSAGVKVVKGGALAAISSSLESKRAKSYLESGEFRGVDLSAKPQHIQEAVLAAASALE